MNLLQLYASLGWLVATPAFGYWGIKRLDQRRRDMTYRPAYTLTYPSEAIAAEQLAAFISSVHGYIFNPNPFVGSATLAFELWGSGGMKTPRIKFPAHLVEDLIPQLHAAIPGMRADIEETPPRRVWTYAEELVMSDKQRGLANEDPAVASRRLTTAFNALGDTETLLLQWVFTADRRKQLPVHDQATKSKFSVVGAVTGGQQASKDAINERRTKLSEQNVKAALRVAVVADTNERAIKLVARVRNALAPTGTAYTHFRRRRNMTRKELQRRIDTAGGSTSWPVNLSVSEFVRISGWVVDGPPGVGFLPGRSMDIPPTADIPREGLKVGISTYPGQERPVAISYPASLQHIQLIGRTGMGKTEATATIGRQIMEDGHGLIVMEKSGDLLKKILDYVPQHRFEDVIVFDMADTERPLGFNPFDQGNPNAAVDGLIGLIRHRFGGRDGLGPWAREGLRNGLQTAADTGLSLVDVVSLLSPRDREEAEWARRVVGKVTDPELKRWWQARLAMKDKDQAARSEPVITRMQEFVGSRELRYIIGQSRSAFDWRDVLLNNKILLISFKGVPDDAVGMACGVFMERLWEAIKSTEKDSLSYLVLDESKEFMDLPIDLEKMFEQARKHKVGVIIANQQLSQLEPLSLQEAVVNNTATKIVFQTFHKDAAALNRETGINNENFKQLPAHHAIVTTPGLTGHKTTVTVKTLKPEKPTGLASARRKQSRMLYGQPKDKVQAEMESRRGGGPDNRRPRPPISGAGWR